MYTQFSSEDSKGNSNTGSCQKLANYLDKEQQNEWLNHEKNDIKTAEVVAEIDQYSKGQIKKEQWKFVEVMYSPSKKEQQHIIAVTLGKKGVENWSELSAEEQTKVKGVFADFVRSSQDLQAQNYNRPGIENCSDLKWYAKIETQRTYKGFDDEVKQGKAKQNEIKKGLNLHAHIIQSRKAMNRKTQLSPMSKHKSKSTKNNIQQGFNRQKFKMDVEKTFDLDFSHSRTKEECYAFKLAEIKHDLVRMDFLKDHSGYEKSKEQRQSKEFVEDKSIKIDVSEILNTLEANELGEMSSNKELTKKNKAKKRNQNQDQSLGF